jgi:hypothetical protein
MPSFEGCGSVGGERRFPVVEGLFGAFESVGKVILYHIRDGTDQGAVRGIVYGKRFAGYRTSPLTMDEASRFKKIAGKGL